MSYELSRAEAQRQWTDPSPPIAVRGSLMTLVLLTASPFFFGPVLVWLLADRVRWRSGVDAFVLVAVAGILLLRVLPAAVAHGGITALGAGIAGLALPAVIERTRVFPSDGLRNTWRLVALIGMGMHGLLDGAALGGVGHGDPALLGIALACYRTAEGMALWWIARHVGLIPRAFAVLFPILTSIAGFALARSWEVQVAGATSMVAFAFLAGVALWVIVRAPGPEQHTRKQTGSLLGTALAVGLLVLIDVCAPLQEQMGSANHLSAIRTFGVLALESSGPVLFGFAIAGLMHSFSLDWLYRWMRRGPPVLQAGKGALIGLPLNVCSCSVLPLYRKLVSSNVPTRAGLAFLVTAPELGAATILLSTKLLGVEMTVFRVGAALALGMAVSLMTTAVVRGNALTAAALISVPPQAPAGSDIGRRLRAGFTYGFGELVDHTLPWVLLGMGIAAVLEPLIDPQAFVGLPVAGQVLAGVLAGIPLYVCAAGSTPLVALLLHKGLSTGAALAILLSGPATNLATFGLLTELHGKRLALATAGSMIVVTVVFAVAYQQFGSVPPVPLHEIAEEGHGPFAWVFVLILALLGGVSVHRQGVRGFIDRIADPHRRFHSQKGLG